MHIRTIYVGVNAHTRLIETKEALTEINHAMMDGADEVAEMSASKSTAHIVYKDGRAVDFRPATPEEIAEHGSKEWDHTHSNFNLWHRFDGSLKALCNKRITANVASRLPAMVNGKWVPKDLFGHNRLSTREDAERYGRLCPKCLAK